MSGTSKSPRLGRDYTIRQAYPFEGPVMHWLFQETPVAGLDWEQPLDSSWVLAVHPDKPEYYGAVSLVASRPIGRMEMLKLAPGLPYKLKALVVRDLIRYGLAVCKQLGCQAVSGASEEALVPTFGRTIQKQWQAVDTGNFTGYLTRV